MTRPKLFLAPHTTLRGNVGHEWRGTTGGKAISPERRAGSFWTWLVNLTREAARGQAFRPGGRAGW